MISIGPRPASERKRWTNVALDTDGHEGVSSCEIIGLDLRIGASVVRVDGIGGVETDEAFRYRGLSRQVLEAAVAHMRAGDAALSMLYGIVGFYPKFGYATAGPDYRIELPAAPASGEVPPGWQVRGFRPEDLGALVELYDGSIRAASTACVRDPDEYPWTRLRDTEPDRRDDECRVVVDHRAVIRGYAWRGTGCGFVPNYTRDEPTRLVLGEVVAGDPEAAEVLVDACTDWASQQGERDGQVVSHVALMIPPEGQVAGAAMTRTATVTSTYIATGGSMVRVLDVERLLRVLEPELTERVSSARPAWTGVLRFETDIGSAAVRIGTDEVAVAADGARPDEVVTLPQSDLARLAVGALPPGTVLGGLAEPPPAAVRQVLATLFPQRHPHTSVIDRY